MMMSDGERGIERLVNTLIRAALHAVCRLRVDDLKKIARAGPVILISNHTTNIEAPALYVLVQPRKATALGKIELWQNGLTRRLMEMWGIVPLRRGTADTTALRAAIAALDDGYLLGVAPEGTRSRTGVLRRAERGVAMLALRTGAPVYPAAQVGFREIGRNIKRLRRTPVTFRVGQPFVVRVPAQEKATAAVLRSVADEIMYQIAVLLPEQYRGPYGDLSAKTTHYIEFLDTTAGTPAEPR